MSINQLDMLGNNQADPPEQWQIVNVVSSVTRSPVEDPAIELPRLEHASIDWC